MKTLIVIAHPDIDSSIVNKYWIEELKKAPEEFTIHELYKVYPTEPFDIKHEQELIDSHDHLVLQFPVYWFSSPPLLKKWLDEVFLEGWAHGPNGGDKLKNKKIALAVSAGSTADDYSIDGRYGHTLEQMLIPFETTFLYCKADYRSIHAFYGEDPSNKELEHNMKNYLTFLRNL
ncbi:NAD(P)H-dependent oxidoreductase [Halalkalibacter hemicellulosilyticus]|uniref:NAD(P)H oxidoreductase YRKL n=1 Tax=Halalkalibacter hemicellulosilyticusJCM 9152 TaxID=1236971 RepID=W4QLT9_9BACI|nr:NAD(P)H-dependent oxidoreductase [Halalkalibacter hemicellulosilyticus]GAE32314.1 NAD(P)H oxidoreductase YRKL [Halalkalibacter hemicellulosilyticusJCM 9152]